MCRIKRWALDIEYIGTNYSGSQIQCEAASSSNKLRINNPSIKTIQGELEKAIRTLIKQDIKTIFSGRTDAGVHAYNQVVHFDYDGELIEKKVINSLNALLPLDISVSNLRVVPADFHSQKSAKWRWYRYLINNRSLRSAWEKPSLLHKASLDEKRINQALEYLLGEHDFSSFKASKTENPAKICNMYYAKCFNKNGIIHVDFIANRFLYNMIRIIIGTLLDIEKYNHHPSKMKDILESCNRLEAGHTVSPDGLYLMKVSYEKFNMEAIINENLFS